MKTLITLGLSLLTSIASFNGIKNTSFKTPVNGAANFGDLTQAQVKTYYTGINEGDKGDALLTKLQTILSKDQIKVNYNSGDTTSTNWSGYYLYERNYDLSPLEESEKGGNYKKSGVWINVMYEETPIYFTTGINKVGEIKYYDASNNIVTVNRTKTGGIDREHVWPKSFGFNSSTDKELYKKFTAGCDAHNLHAAESMGNQDGHNNRPFGNVANKATATQTFSGLTNNLVGYTGPNKDGIEVFEPLDSWKGDIARSLFYMAARYHTYEHLGGVDETPSLRLGNGVSRNTTTAPAETKNNPSTYGQLEDLLAWNTIDPVNDFERHRNNLIHQNVQSNRNPFVDYPQWADACFDTNSNGASFDTTITTPPEEQHTYELKIKTSLNFKKHYYNFEQFNPSGLVLEFYVDDVYTPVTNYQVYMGDQIMTSDYTILGIGTHELYATVKYKNQVIKSSNTITVTFELSIPQIAILGGIVLVLLILIILFIVWASKRKNRKKIKAFENKVTKINKEIQKVNKDKTKRKSKKNK